MEHTDSPLILFLNELMQRKGLIPSQLAAQLGISHSTVSRWLRGQDIPSTKSCQKLAEYSGTPMQKILSISGYIPEIAEPQSTSWPEFREYAERKYPYELDDDLITLIESLIEQRRGRYYWEKDD